MQHDQGGHGHPSLSGRGGQAGLLSEQVPAEKELTTSVNGWGPLGAGA